LVATTVAVIFIWCYERVFFVDLFPVFYFDDGYILVESDISFGFRFGPSLFGLF